MLTSRSLARCLLLLSVNAVLLASSATAHQDHALAFPTPTPAPAVVARQLFPIGNSNTNTGTENTSNTAANTNTETTSAATPTTSDTTTTTTTAETTTTTSPTTTSAPSTSNTSQTTTTTTGPPPTTSNPSTPTTQNTPSPPPVESTVMTSNGVEVTVVITPSASSTSTGAPSSSAGADDSGTKTEGISKSTIIGLSVSGGVALIGLISFAIWKFTRKRFSDDDFDNEAIKWPELNAHGDGPTHALPTNRTGGAGFETSSQVNLTRPDSRAGSIAPSAATSTAELYSNRSDPYAVPPLPHMNPNMPYRDDPSQVYYDNDPYASAVAAAPMEAIPMTQINRTRSPGPQMAYGYDGRVSPGPQQSLSANYRTASPGPNAALYGGRASPAPPMGRMSPGPQMAYGPGQGY